MDGGGSAAVSVKDLNDTASRVKNFRARATRGTDKEEFCQRLVKAALVV